jgi:hypothetical protein
MSTLALGCPWSSRRNKLQLELREVRSPEFQIISLFLSYLHADTKFVECIDRRQNKAGIIYWREIHDAPAGPLERIVTNAIEQNPDCEHITQKRNSK